MPKAKKMPDGVICLKTNGKALTKADKKAIRQFAEFLRGVPRCPNCLHKAKSHGEWGCRKCSCPQSIGGVEYFHKKRAAKKAEANG